MSNTYVYKTKDFYISSLLRAIGYQLIELQRHSNDLVSFVFDIPADTAKQIIDDYWDKKIKIDARTLIESINELKTRLHNKS